jgi:hypothetical protein
MNSHSEPVESGQPRLYHLRLSADKWVEAVDQLNKRGVLKFIYAEEPATIHLTAYRRPDPYWSHGRAFGPDLEVRWSRRRDGKVDLTLLTESDLPEQVDWQPIPLLENASATLEAVVEDGRVMLRGVSRRHGKSPYGGDPKAPNEWTESRIPRPLAYPVDAGDPPRRWARLSVRTYRVNGCPLLTRMVDLEVTSDVERL